MARNSFIHRGGAQLLRRVSVACGVTLVAASVSTSGLAYAAPSAAYTGYSSYVPEVVIVEGKIGETQVKVQGDKTYPEGMKFKHVANSQRSYGSWVVIDQNSGKFTIDTSKHTHIFTNGKAEYTSIRLDVIYPDHKPPTTASFETIDAGKVTVLQDSDKDGVPDKDQNGAVKDQCPGTAEGAKVNDADGCPLAPVLQTATVTGEVGTALTNTTMAITNEGKLTLNACEFTDQDKSAGLVVELGADDNACVISGTPNKPGQSEVTVKLNYLDGKNAPASTTASAKLNIADKDTDKDGKLDAEDKCPNTPFGGTVDAQGCAVKPHMEDANVTGIAGSKINETTLPIINDGNVKLLECTGNLPEGLSLALNHDETACVVSGTPQAAVDTKVPAMLKYTSDHGSTEEVQAQLTLNIAEKPVVTPKSSETYKDLAYAGAAVVAGESGKVAPPTARAGKLPENTRFELTAESKAKFPWISEDAAHAGAWNLNPEVSVAAGDYVAQVAVSFPDQSTLTVDMKIAVTAKPEKPEPGTPDPGKPDPGKPEPGKPDPGKPEPGKPDPGKPENPGSDPAKSDSDKDGVVDAEDKCPDTAAGAKVDAKGCSVASAQPRTPMISEKQTDKSLPATGSIAGALAVASLIVTLAGAGLLARRRAV